MTRSLRYQREHGFTAVELVLVIVVLAIVVSVTMWQVDKARQARLREESAANLKTLNKAANVVWSYITAEGTPYTRRDSWPQLSSRPGQLSPDPTSRYAATLQKIEGHIALISPAHPYVEKMRRAALADPESSFTDDSYWYLGYALPTEEAGLAFVEAYKKTVEETGKPTSGDIELESPIEVNEDKNWEPMSALSPLARMRRVPSVSRSGGEIHFLPKASVEAGIHPFPPRKLPPILIFIEHPGLQRGGSNVLWGDGTVEFMPYPGPWPMTEKFIKALESLDELKGKE